MQKFKLATLYLLLLLQTAVTENFSLSSSEKLSTLGSSFTSALFHPFDVNPSPPSCRALSYCFTIGTYEKKCD